MLSFIFPLRIPACYTHSDPFPVYLFCCTGPMSSFVKLYKASKQRQPKMFGERQAKYFLRWRGDFMPDSAIMSRLSSPCTISRKREDFKLSLGAAGNFLFLGGTRGWHQARWNQIPAVCSPLSKRVLPGYLAAGGDNQHSALWSAGEEPSRLKLQKSHEHFLPSPPLTAALVGI